MIARYLTFVLGGEQFGLDVACVKEIVEYGRVTPVPMMPSWVRGVTNLRGDVVPVLDLAARFSGATAAQTRRTCIVVVELDDGGERRSVGVVVDAVNAVLDIAEADVEAPPETGALVRRDFIRGMGKVEDRFVVLLDAARALSDGNAAQSHPSDTYEDRP